MRLVGVGKSYGRGRPVLAGVDLTLDPGEIIAITGGNGSGKSTLLRVLAGISRHDNGVVVGRPRQVGYVPERFPSDERLSARSYLAHMGRVRGLSSRRAVDRSMSLLDRLALAGGQDTPLRRLSKGNLQKIALAQALLVRPRLLVLDEPWSGLDSSAHGVLEEIIAESANAGVTVAFTDHRDAVVRVNAMRAYRMSKGGLDLVERDTELARVLVTRLVLEAPTEPDSATPLAGALSVHHEGGRVVVRVDKAHADRLLLDALHQGWSVIQVDEAQQATVDKNAFAHGDPQ